MINYFSPETYYKRRKNLLNEIKNGIILFLGNQNASINYKDNHYRFRQDSSFLYFFGIDLPNFAAIMDAESGEEIIFADDFSQEDIIWMGAQPLVKDLTAICKVKQTQCFEDIYKYLQNVTDQNRIIHFLPPYRYHHILFYEKIFKTVFLPSSELIRTVVKLREIKTEEEIKEIEKACNVAYQMHLSVMMAAKPGKTEKELTIQMEKIASEKAYMPSFQIILSQNGHILHNHLHDKTLKKGRLLLVDAGAETDLHYASDFTRVTPVGGVFSSKQKDIYQIVLDANEKATSLIHPGITFYDIHMAACKVVVEGLKNIGIMKNNTDEALASGAHTLFMPHGLGHMMGLDVHDMESLGEDFVGYSATVKRSKQFGTAYLRLGKELKQGFVLTNEPGIYFIPMLIHQWKKQNLFKEFINYDKLEKEYLDFGGIRLEDDILVTDTGCRLLGEKRLPITIGEIETIAKN